MPPARVVRSRVRALTRHVDPAAPCTPNTLPDDVDTRGRLRPVHVAAPRPPRRGPEGHLDRAGILDPLKVVRTALQSAVSVAGTLLLAEATLTDAPEESPAKHAAAMNASAMS